MDSQFFVKDKYIKYVLFGALAIGVASTYIAIGVQGRIGPLMVFNCFDAFGIGALYAWARQDSTRCTQFERSVKIMVVAAVGIYFYWKLYQFFDHPTSALFLMKTINSIISIWLIILVVNNRSVWVGKYLLGNRFLNYIGKISYGIYLYHYIYIGLLFNRVNGFLYNITLPYPALNKTIHDSHVDYWIEVSLMICIAAISYALIEKPLLNLKKYFNYNEKPTRQAA